MVPFRHVELRMVTICSVIVVDIITTSGWEVNVRNILLSQG